VALSWGANGLALGTIFLLAIVLGATNAASGTFAVYDALSTGSLFAFHLALRTSAHRVADSRASWVIALPAARRVALFSRRANNGNKTQGCYNESSHDFFLGKGSQRQDLQMVRIKGGKRRWNKLAQRLELVGQVI